MRAEQHYATCARRQYGCIIGPPTAVHMLKPSNSLQHIACLLAVMSFDACILVFYFVYFHFICMYFHCTVNLLGAIVSSPVCLVVHSHNAYVKLSYVLFLRQIEGLIEMID